MTTSLLNQQTPSEISLSLARRLSQRRKEHGLTQAKLSTKADVSLGSLKRFESTGEISLKSLIKLAIALNSEGDLDQLFTRKHYRSIQEILDEQH